MTRSASTRRRMFRSNTIVPAPQDRPPLAFIIIVFAVCVSPLVGFVLWGWF